MIDRIEILYSRLRRLVSRNRWTARILGFPPAPKERQEGVGLILVQIDGLGRQVLERALLEGHMPFVRQLIREEEHRLFSLYSGLPSSTPGSQAELFYGARTFVPAFGFRDRELGRVIRMNDPYTASRIEARLKEDHVGLFRGGSAWSNIYGGEASESHLTAATTGIQTVLSALNPQKLIFVLLGNGWSLVRFVSNLVVETLLAFYDFFRGTVSGRNFLAELRFVPTRVIVTAGMREIIAAGAAVDAERGLPVIQMNFLGYDEHGHRRGPDSLFALWTLRGIDKSIRRVWNAGHRSPARDYQMWIYSDHGQERTVPYPVRYGESVAQAVRRIHQEWLKSESEVALAERHTVTRRSPEREEAEALQTSRTEARRQWLEEELPEWLRLAEEREREDAERAGAGRAGAGRMGSGHTERVDDISDDDARPERIEVVHQGPVGFVYLPDEPTTESRRDLARRLAREGHIPGVAVPAGDEEIELFLSDGRDLRLPRDRAEFLGAHHPELDRVSEDLVRVVQHPDAGDIVLMGFNRDEPMSLQLENGSHGGPGPRETGAFVLLPREGPRPTEGRLRMSELRDLALDHLEGRGADVAHGWHRAGDVPQRFRLLSYNVHSCRGMDGVYSPERIARVIARERPDVVCLQELDNGSRRSGWRHQTAEIARAIAAEAEFHGISRVDDGEFGNAVLSRHPMRTVRADTLPTDFGKERGALWVAITLGDIEVQVLNTHLSIVETERRQQADALVSPDWLDHPDFRAPSVVCGDFNAGPRSYTCRRIGERLSDVDGDLWRPRETWSSRVPLRRIDHVFVSEGLEAADVRVPRDQLTRVSSDHLPLVVDLVLDLQGVASSTTIRRAADDSGVAKRNQ